MVRCGGTGEERVIAKGAWLNVVEHPIERAVKPLFVDIHGPRHITKGATRTFTKVV